MFESFKKRSTQAELMDDQNTDYDNFRDCLRDLETVNKLTLDYRPTVCWLRQIFKNIFDLRPISIIDVGSGGGDTLRFIARWVSRRGPAIKLTGVDLNPWSRQYAQGQTRTNTDIKFETSDIFSFEPTRQADFIVSSLFCHHLNDQQLIKFLKWMEQHASKGWFVNDLHRHPIAYYSFKYLSRLLCFHYMVQHDGPISVARGFSKQDWIQALIAAHIPLNQVRISWFFPFRYCLTRFKP